MEFNSSNLLRNDRKLEIQNELIFSKGISVLDGAVLSIVFPSQMLGGDEFPQFVLLIIILFIFNLEGQSSEKEEWHVSNLSFDLEQFTQ